VCVYVCVCGICVQAVLLMSCGITMVVIALLNMNLTDGLLEDMCQSGAEDAVCVCVCVCVCKCVCEKESGAEYAVCV